MAASQVAKKFIETRTQKIREGIFKKVDCDGDGKISLTEYFGIFEEHGIEVTEAETERVKKLAGEDQHLSKKDFIGHLKTSNFFMKSFDKNKDGVVTETEMLTRAELAFSFLDPKKTGYITLRQFRMISKKLSQEEVKALMMKLDRDQDGKLSFEEFKVLFHRNERRRRSDAAKKDSSRRKSVRVQPDVEHSVLFQFSRLSLRNTKTKFSEHATPCEADSGHVEENHTTTGSSKSGSAIQQHRQRSQSERRKTSVCQGTRDRRSCSPDIAKFTKGQFIFKTWEAEPEKTK